MANDNKKDKTPQEASVKITLDDIYKTLKSTHDRLVSLENDMKSKMEVDGIPSDIDDLYGKIEDIHRRVINLEKKIDNHIQWSEGESHGTTQTHKFWIKVLSGIVALLTILQIITFFS